MKKLTLTEWAAVAEIFGTIVVVVSLLFVAYSVNQNTIAVQVTNDNFIYELQYARARDIVSSPGMAEIYVKIRRGTELSDVEEERFLWDKLQELSLWELAFNRHRDGLYSTQLWDGWDVYYSVSLLAQLPEESWQEAKRFYQHDFINHVDAAYAAKSDGNQ